MPTASVCGYSGQVTGAAVTEVTQWSVVLNVAAEDASSFSSAGYRERISCLRGGSFTYRSIGSYEGTGPVTVHFLTGHGLSIGGTAIITKVDVETPVSGIISYNSSGVFTGAISGGLLPTTPP